MPYPVLMSYHPNIQTNRLIKGDNRIITGDLNDFYTDDEILGSLCKTYPSLKPVEILQHLSAHKMIIPEGELWIDA